jgi:hypothetical protein
MEDSAPLEHIHKTANKIVENSPQNEYINPEVPTEGMSKGEYLGQIGPPVYSNLNVRYKNVSSKFKKNYEEIKWNNNNNNNNNQIKSIKKKGVKLTQVYKNN